jgi:hypothetical protein
VVLKRNLLLLDQPWLFTKHNLTLAFDTKSPTLALADAFLRPYRYSNLAIPTMPTISESQALFNKQTMQRRALGSPGPSTLVSKSELGVGSTEKNDKETAHLAEPLEASIRDFLTPLMEHKVVVDRIMRFLFPGDSINICEYAKGDAVSPNHAKQHMYEVTDRNSLDSTRTFHKTTYFASQYPKALDIASVIKQRPANNNPFCDFSLSVLLVSKAFYNLGVKCLYGRNFRFQCSATGAKIFLFKHAAHVRSMTQVDLFYHFRIESNVIETDGEAWHDLICKVRHELSYIPKIHLHVGHGFWTKTFWKNWRGPNAVIEQRGVRENGEYRPFFLYDVAKIAAPAERWQNHLDPATLCTEGTQIQVSIKIEEVASSEDRSIVEMTSKVRFVERLNDELLKRGQTRPLFRISNEPLSTYPRKLSGYPRRITYTRTRNESWRR